jgi:ABC-type siderophore export system fused ATPase/permease subunit
VPWAKRVIDFKGIRLYIQPIWREIMNDERLAQLERQVADLTAKVRFQGRLVKIGCVVLAVLLFACGDFYMAILPLSIFLVPWAIIYIGITLGRALRMRSERKRKLALRPGERILGELYR